MALTNIYVTGFGKIKEDWHIHFIMQCLEQIGLRDYHTLSTYRAYTLPRIAFLPGDNKNFSFESIGDVLEHVKEQFGVDVLQVLVSNPNMFRVDHWLSSHYVDVDDDSEAGEEGVIESKDIIPIADCIMSSEKCVEILDAIESDRDFDVLPFGSKLDIKHIKADRTYHFPGALVRDVRQIWSTLMQEHLKGSGTHEAARRLRDLFESKLRQVVELGHVVERVDPSSSQETLEAAEPNFAKRKRSEDGDVQRKGKRSAREKAMEAAVISGVLRA